MAHLNLRDRVIETTIAYVGAEPNAGATNLAQVKGDVRRGRPGALEETQVGGDRLLALDWRPSDGGRLNDCELKVKLVAASSPLESEAMQSLLVDADGLVLMLDSDPEASDGNRRAVAAVHEVLARDPQRKVPVVVQINRQHEEVEGSEPSASLDVLADEKWPRLEACVAKGDGVMETLQRAVDVVVESMQAAKRDDRNDANAARGNLRAEGNPLLGALRQILQATVSEQIATLEARLVEKLERQMKPAFGALEARMDRLDGAMNDLGHGKGQTGERPASRGEVAQMETRTIAAVTSLCDALEKKLATFEASMERLESTVIAAGERVATSGEKTASRADLEKIELRLTRDAAAHREAIAKDVSGHRDALVTELKDHRKTSRDEVTRALAAATMPLQRALDALATEAKKWGASAGSSDAASAIERFGAKSETLEGQVTALIQESRTVATQVDELFSQLEHVDAHVARRVAEIREALAVLHEKSDGRAEALQTELTAITTELKKKKGWFS